MTEYKDIVRPQGAGAGADYTYFPTQSAVPANFTGPAWFEDTGQMVSYKNGVTVGNIASNLYKGINDKMPLANELLPFGVAAVSSATITGATATPSVDSTLLFRGRPTTKVAITAGASGGHFEVGITGATHDIPLVSQDWLSKNTFIAIKAAAGEVLSANIFIGDATFANFKFESLVSVGVTDNGWSLFMRRRLTGDGSITGTPNYAAPVRYKLRVVLSNMTVANTINVASCYATPLQKPTVVITCDDGDITALYLRDAAAARGIPVSFSIDRSKVNTAGGWTTQQLVDTINTKPGLFELTNHSVENINCRVLGDNEYFRRVEDCRVFLEGIGAGISARIHPFVQGYYTQVGETTGAGAPLSAIQTLLKDAGYLSARTVETSGVMSNSTGIAAVHGDTPMMFRLPIAADLDAAYDLATVKTNLLGTAAAGGAFIMCHRFASSAGSPGDVTWVAGYDATYGILDLLDWLVERREVDGWQIITWSEWIQQTLDNRSTDII